VLDTEGTLLHATGLARAMQVQHLLRSQLCTEQSVASSRSRTIGIQGKPHLVRVYRCGDTDIVLLLETVESGDGGSQPGGDQGCRELDAILGSSTAICALKKEVQRIAPLDVAVMLVGESGSGKELIAQCLHGISRRHSAPYVAVNSSALPATLFESEFFGYDAGAFTGADRRGKRGRFEQAHGGTLFLDEVGDMPVEVQVKLLRVLQDGRFERLGSERAVFSDFRLVCATHRDLIGMISLGQFRMDLFYRISTVTLRVPSLRERLDDIPILVDSFLRQFARRNGTQPLTASPAALEFLQAQAWPGNIRQLQHEVEKAAIFADGHVVGVADFRVAHVAPPSFGAPTNCLNESVREAIDEVEATMIRDALSKYQGNKKRAAEALGISRGYLYKKLAGKNAVHPNEAT
jgi:transcriptional regulator with PAS, ATPase and Fis domain